MNDAWQEVGKNLGIIAGALVIFGGLAKYLVSDWFEKNKELANLKYNNSEKMISKLESKVEELEKGLQAHAQKLVEHSSQLKHTEHAIAEVLKQVQEYAKDTRATVNKLAELSHKRFNKLEESAAKPTKSVVEKFGKDSFIVRSAPKDEDEGDE